VLIEYGSGNIQASATGDKCKLEESK